VLARDPPAGDDNVALDRPTDDDDVVAQGMLTAGRIREKWSALVLFHGMLWKRSGLSLEFTPSLPVCQIWRGCDKGAAAEGDVEYIGRFAADLAIRSERRRDEEGRACIEMRGAALMPHYEPPLGRKGNRDEVRHVHQGTN
jgi:hypothetical protein